MSEERLGSATVRSRTEGRFGFGSEYRIRSSHDFSSVLGVHQALRSAHVTLNHAPNGLGWARLGLVVGRRMVKRAVGRNLIKRIAREAFRSVSPRLGALDVVLRVSKPMAEIERGGLRLEIDGLLGRLAR